MSIKLCLSVPEPISGRDGSNYFIFIGGGGGGAGDGGSGEPPLDLLLFSVSRFRMKIIDQGIQRKRATEVMMM